MAKDVYDMTDEEIMSMSNPPESDDKEQSNPEETSEQEELQEDTQEVQDEEHSEEQVNQEDTEDHEDTENKEELEESTVYSENNENNDNSSESSDKIQKDTNNETPDYEGFYKRVMAPFKANGKSIQLNSPEEAIALMQKGVDYTRKMQDIARYRKPMMMLEKANLLNEDQISFFIDLSNGNQEAIRKLLKDKGIDTLDLPSDDEPINYQAGSHKLSDTEVELTEQVKELQVQEGGPEFLKEVLAYDQQSRNAIYAEPRVLSILFNQKKSGIYQRITDEVERQRLLGQIPDNVPFINAYNAVGQMLFGPKSQSRNGSQPLARKPAITSNKLNNTQRAKSAGITRTSGKASRVTKNPLTMSDEEFIKMFGE